MGWGGEKKKKKRKRKKDEQKMEYDIFLSITVKVYWSLLWLRCQGPVVKGMETRNIVRKWVSEG